MDQDALLRIVLLAMSLAVAGFAVLYVAVRKPGASARSKALLIFFSLYAVLKLDELCVVTGAYMAIPHAAGIAAPLRMLVAPAFLLYVRAMTAPSGAVFCRSDLWALCGPAGFFLLMSWYFILPADAKRDMMSLAYSDPALRDLAFTMCRVLFAWFFLFSAIYVGLSLHSLNRHLKGMKAWVSNLDNKSLSWLRTASFLLLLMLGWYAAGELWAFSGTRPAAFSDVTALLELAAVALFCAFALPQPPVQGQVLPDAGQVPSGRWTLPDAELARIGTALEACMQTQRLYARSDLALKDLAAAVKRSEDHVTQALGRHLNTSFYTFINAHRIEEARRLLRDTALPVLEVGLEVGFNTKSTFNAAFRKMTGQTPSAYRKSTPPKNSDKTYGSEEQDDTSWQAR